MLLSPRSALLLPALLASCASSAPAPQTAATAPATTAAPATASPAPAKAPELKVSTLEGVDESLLDKGVSPCDDFYQFACGSWMKQTKLPDDESVWVRSFSVINDANVTSLKETLEKDAAGKGDGPYAKQLGDFYASCMDEEGIEKAGLSGLKDELEAIEKVKDSSSLTAALSHLHAIGIDVAFHFDSQVDDKDSGMVIGHFGQGGLGLPDRDYYFKADAKSKEIREKYEAHIEHMLALIGETPVRAKADAKIIVRLETKLADASMTRVEQRDPKAIYNRLDLAGLTKAAPQLSFSSYLAARGVPTVTAINVAQPKFAAAVGGLVKTTPSAEWKAYLRWHLLLGLASTLPKAVVDERFAFNHFLSGAKVLPPRWKRCTRMIDRSMGEALAIPFVRDHLGEEGKKSTRTMVAGIELAMKQNLELLPWMDQKTREKGLEKVSLVSNMIGYPDVWRNYDGLDISRSSYTKSVIAASAFERKRDLAKIGRPTDKSEWAMSPPTVNAYYEPTLNEMVFPAGILQRPFYANKFADAVNYGAIGVVIGHELTHGFDDEGREYDAAGNMSDWWSPDVSAEFEKRAACVARQYDDYTVDGNVHLNGKATLGENIADLGGIKISYKAFRKAHPTVEKIGSFTDDQQFFLGFAQAWCTNIRPEEARERASTDPHSPSQFRVNGPLGNSSEFARAFSCKEGEKMIRPKETRCEVW